jgi:hypothetical protein
MTDFDAGKDDLYARAAAREKEAVDTATAVIWSGTKSGDDAKALAIEIVAAIMPGIYRAGREDEKASGDTHAPPIAPCQDIVNLWQSDVAAFAYQNLTIEGRTRSEIAQEIRNSRDKWFADNDITMEGIESGDHLAASRSFATLAQTIWSERTYLADMVERRWTK